MELIKTRYSKIKIPDNLKISPREWRKENPDKIKIDDFPDFDVIILPFEGIIVSSDGFSLSDNLASEDPIDVFLREKASSVEISLKGEKKVLILFQGEADGILPIRLNLKLDGKFKIMEVWRGKVDAVPISSLKFFLHKNSKVDFFHLENSEGKSIVQKRDFFIGEGGELKAGRIWTGNSKIFSFDNFFLDGVKAFCEMYEVILAKENKFLEINSKIEHKERETKGFLSAKIVLYDFSSVYYVGGAKIHKQGADSDSYIELRSIKMSEKARVYVVPLMEIDTNDVKAKHSSSVSKVGKDELFYIMSRGIDEKEAEKLIIDGFIGEAIMKFPSGFEKFIPTPLLPFQTF